MLLPATKLKRGLFSATFLFCFWNVDCLVDDSKDCSLVQWQFQSARSSVGLRFFTVAWINGVRREICTPCNRKWTTIIILRKAKAWSLSACFKVSCFSRLFPTGVKGANKVNCKWSKEQWVIVKILPSECSIFKDMWISSMLNNQCIQNN